MKILSWNVRGLGKPSAFRHLRLLVKEQSPHVLFLMETKLGPNVISRFRNVLHFNNGLEVPRVGLGGGLLLLWKDDIDVSILNYNTNVIDCYIASPNQPRWHFTAFYGAPCTQLRSQTWTLLERLKDVSPLSPWLVIGDFNEILSNDNKVGGAPRNEAQMEQFRKALDCCRLNEVPFEGDPYTWIKGRRTVNTVKERLDWCFVNDCWNSHFSPIVTRHLDYYTSDHRAIVVNVSLKNSDQQPQQRRTRFRFEQMWLQNEEVANIIQQQWTSPVAGSAIDKFLHNIAACTSSLQQWHQRSRVDWLQSGDQNTKFFHAHASSRKAANRIHFLLDSNGAKTTSNEGISNIITEFFDNLFTATSVNPTAIAQFTSAIPTTITPAINHSLTAPFTEMEVTTALKTMSPDKSPGSDGMSAMFYQNYWHIVGSSVTDVVLGVLNHGLDMDSINKAIITLVPKVSSPNTIADFRPISLCNVIYKIISKMIVLRFKEALPLVISETQSAFLSNRLITDNVLVAFELVHNIQHQKRGKKGFSALKLDTSKAFDRVEWDYLRAVMDKMGFAKSWTDLIFKCLSSSSLTFALNGDTTGLVRPTRGLRQGDPLSPYLFLICSGRLSRLLQHEEAIGNLQGLRITRQAPSISHLLFADDSLLFCEATNTSALAIQRALDIYHKASGQMLNPHKSVMSFSPNTPMAAQLFFQQTLSMPISECHERYLELPSYSGRDKKVLFSHIKERIWKLMHAWNEKLFSVGGKEVLLKVVVQSIPTYAMSCFRLTKTFCQQLESMMANFWWGSNKDGSKIHWKRWNLLCKSKFEGGMEFRSFIHYNQALLASQAWRILDMPNSLLSRLLKSRYFPHNSFLEARLGSPSLTWQSIHWGRELLAKGLRYKVGNGFHIQSGLDKWIPGHTEFRPITYTGSPSQPVACFITDQREWNLDALHNYFGQMDIDKIVSIPLSFFPMVDRLIWHHTTSGEYTVKSGFHLAATLDEQQNSSTSDLHNSWWKTFWHLSLPSKIKIFAWKVMHNVLPTAAALHRRKVLDSAACSMCSCAWESIGHALFSCPHAKAVWNHTGFVMDYPKAQQMFNGDYIFYLSTLHSQRDFELIICNLWAIWSSRNRSLHGSSRPDGKQTATFAKDYVEKFRLSSTRKHTNHAPSIAGNTASSATTSNNLQEVRWQPPDATGFKLNIDAAVNSATKTLGVGAIVRDHYGQVIAVLSKPTQGCFRSDEMEAKALFHSLNWALQQQLHITNIKTDALRVFHALTTTSTDLSCFSDLILDVRCLLSFFLEARISHVKRNANHAAHGLAKHALALDQDICWIGEIPDPISSIVVIDC
ncbi:uncharacterized protein LOC133038517 [Cannabis sativa]|uniref:uncharacterized protein LOC133038517 n=1 Tax=Cannabis sativa TaxID=3483 RepID=UPI0029C9D40E|nr:uncharacterized protein LOC133038517 [Cannabis sativa]